MPKPNLLIVDDHSPYLKLMTHLLAADGFQVCTAASAQEALADLDFVNPDLILTDLGLPDLDGRDLTRRLKADGRWQHVPVVAVTGLRTDRESALDAGCADFFSKPVDTRGLRRCLKTLVAP